MYVCICNGVNEHTITQAVRRGVHDFDDLAVELGVASCCGKCADAVCRVVDNTLLEDCARIASESPGRGHPA